MRRFSEAVLVVGSVSLLFATGCTSAPGAPLGVTAVAGNAQALVSWSAPADNGGAAVTTYTVTSSPGARTASATGGKTTATVSGLTNGTSYTFAVAATNKAGKGPSSLPSNPVTPLAVPDAPTAVTATAGDGQAMVSWTAPDKEGGSAIDTYMVTSSPGGLTATVSAPATSATVLGLANGTSYTFTVIATNSVGNSLPSSASTAVTPATVPDAPTAVTATASDAQATVTWTAPKNDGGSAITGYTITSTPGALTATVTAPATTATITDLTNGTAYTFTVVATSSVGDSAPSLPSNPVTPMVVPGAPTAVTAVAGNAEATVSWTAPANTGGAVVVAYTVTSSPGNVTATVAASATSAVVTGLTNGTSYTFTVTATNAFGNSVASSPSNSVTPATIPDAPTGVAAVRADGQATVSWTAPATDGGSAVTGYTVTATPGGLTATASADATSATVTGLTNGTAYTFTVVATNAVGSSDPSLPSNPVTPAAVPDAPTGVTATAGNQQATVTWTAPAHDGGAGMLVYTVTSTPGNLIAIVPAPAMSATVTGLTNGTSYTFDVVATNTVGSSAASSPSNAVTPTTAPGAPTGVTASGGNAQATVSWIAPLQEGGSAVTGYVVTSAPGGLTATAAAGATSATVTGLTNGMAYTFTVVATSNAGDSAPSLPSNAVTPFEVTAVAAGGAATCALVNGGVWCWGLGADGELGNGSFANSASPVPVSGLTSGVQQIAAGGQNACAIAGGTVWCWGDNSYGQLANGTTTSSDVPVKVTGLPSGVQGIAAGYRSCAVANGTVWCWGNVAGSVPTPVSGLNGVTAVAGDRPACALASGSVWCWDVGAPARVSGLPAGIEAISGYSGNVCALAGNGVWCWSDSPTPVLVTGLPSGVQSVAPGSLSTCATTSTSVWCWGSNGEGQLGDGTTTNSTSPVQVLGISAGVTDVSTGWAHACALVGNSVQCWGDNRYDQLGQANVTRSPVPMKVDDSAW